MTDLLVVLATFILDFVLGFLAEVNYGRYTMLFINMSKTSITLAIYGVCC